MYVRSASISSGCEGELGHGRMSSDNTFSQGLGQVLYGIALVQDAERRRRLQRTFPSRTGGMAARAVLLGDGTAALQRRGAGAAGKGAAQSSRHSPTSNRNGMAFMLPHTGGLEWSCGTELHRGGVNSYVCTLCVEWRSRMRELRFCSGRILRAHEQHDRVPAHVVRHPVAEVGPEGGRGPRQRPWGPSTGRAASSEFPARWRRTLHRRPRRPACAG